MQQKEIKDLKNVERLEDKLIGIILNDNSTLEECTMRLDVNDFYRSSHKKIFETIGTLYSEGKKVDVHTVTNYINDNKKVQFPDSQVIVESISNDYIDSDGFINYIEIIKNSSIKRQIDALCSYAQLEKVDFVNSSDWIYEFENKMLSITGSRKTTQLKNMLEVTSSYQKKLESTHQGANEISGTPSGFESIDNITNGFQPGDLIILAARPGIGKTALALNFLVNAAKDIQKRKQTNECVVMFSLEMGTDQLCQRMVSSEALVDISLARKGNWDRTQWNSLISTLSEIAELPIYIDDASNLSISDIQAKLNQISVNKKIRLVVIDYLQLLSGPTKSSQINRQQEVALISRMLKAIARNINVPLIALAQLSRKIEERKGDNPRPILSDLRESGSIEQDADIVTFLNYEQVEGNNETQYNNRVMVEYIVEKHRNGPTGIAKLDFIKSYGKYINRKE